VDELDELLQELPELLLGELLELGDELEGDEETELLGDDENELLGELKPPDELLAMLDDEVPDVPEEDCGDEFWLLEPLCWDEDEPQK
jgi:hypothetical protein